MTQQYVPRQYQSQQGFAGAVPGRTTPQTTRFDDVWGNPNEGHDPNRPMAMTGPTMAAARPQAGMGNLPNGGYGGTGSTYNPTTNSFAPGPAPQSQVPLPAGVPYGTQLAAAYQPGYAQQLNSLYAAGRAPGQASFGNQQQRPATGGSGGQGGQGDPGLNAFMDRGPYNSLVDRGNQFIRGGIPTNANNLMASSPAFRGMNPGAMQSLNQQWGDRGTDLQNQAGLEFSRQAGVQIPQFLLQQMLGIKGLENDWFGLQNDQYRTGMNQQFGGINQILKLLGGMGNLF